MDALIDIILYDALGRSHAFAFHGEQGGKQGCAHTRRNLQGATRLGAIANHTRQVGHHVLDGIADARIISTHQVGDATTTTRRGDDTSTEGRQLAQALLDIDGGEMAQRQGTNQLLLGILILRGIHNHGIGGTDTLVATTAVAHHRNHRPTHSGIASRSRARDDMREDIVAEDAMAQRTVHRLAQAMTIVALDGKFRRLDVVRPDH